MGVLVSDITAPKNHKSDVQESEEDNTIGMVRLAKNNKHISATFIIFLVVAIDLM